MSRDPNSGVYYEVHGSGRPLVLGFPLIASYGEIFGAANSSVLRRFLDGLCDDYRVLVFDYPSIGKSDAIPPSELTAERVCADLASVANAAGFEHFALWGYSWGAAAALQFAVRSDRVDALIAGGWPPIGAPYAQILEASRANIADPPSSSLVVLREPAQYAQWATFYASLAEWPEREAIGSLRVPRMTFFGANGDTESGSYPLPLATIYRQHRGELEAMGWRVVEIADRGHEVGIDPDIVVPLVRSFLGTRMCP